MAIKKIGIITSGGDCGGLNAVIKGIAREAYAQGIESVVIPNGYAGLYNLLDMQHVVTLNAERVSRIEASLAGSEAGHSRFKIKKIADPKKYDRIKEGLKKFGIDARPAPGDPCSTQTPAPGSAPFRRPSPRPREAVPW